MGGWAQSATPHHHYGTEIHGPTTEIVLTKKCEIEKYKAKKPNCHAARTSALMIKMHRVGVGGWSEWG